MNTVSLFLNEHLLVQIGQVKVNDRIIEELVGRKTHEVLHVDGDTSDCGPRWVRQQLLVLAATKIQCIVLTNSLFHNITEEL